MIELDRGLALYLRFDETAGLYAKDSSGNGNHGLVERATGTDWVMANGRAGLKLDRPSETFLRVLEHPSLSPAAALSVAVWVSNGAWCTTGDHPRVLQKAATDTGDSFTQLILSCDQQGLRFDVYIADVLVTVSGPALPADQLWRHLAATYDGVAARLYVDGAMVGSTPAAGPVNGPDPGGASWLMVGSKNGYGHFFDGVVDDLLMYDRALGPAEILALARGSRPAVTAPALAESKLTGPVFGLAGQAPRLYDDNISTYFQILGAGSAGMDLGRAFYLTRVRFHPTNIHARAVGIAFQRSLQGETAGYTEVYRIGSVPSPAVWSQQSLDPRAAGRFVRMLCPGGTDCDLAEVEFWGMK